MLNYKWTRKVDRGPRVHDITLSDTNRAYGLPTGDKRVSTRVFLAVLALSLVAVLLTWSLIDVGASLIVALLCTILITLSLD